MTPAPVLGAADSLPPWARWAETTPYTVGIEEEVMILEPGGWSLATPADGFLARLPGELAAQLTPETHDSAIELATSPHLIAADAGGDLHSLRTRLVEHLQDEGLRAGVAGTHPMAVWGDVTVSSGARYQLVYESMRELARREPTFALHVHVGVAGPDDAVRLFNRLRFHVPLLLALSANSPFWQGRDTGLCSARTSIFQAFPRVGLPRAFGDYEAYVDVVQRLLRADAFPEPTFLWWDVRLQPRFGTVEVRVMDAQTTAARAGALAALVQTIAHLELEEGYVDTPPDWPEILHENRFLAARDGIDAVFIDSDSAQRVPAREQLERLLERARPHAQELGCEQALDVLIEMAEQPGAECQRESATISGLGHPLAWLAQKFED